MSINRLKTAGSEFKKHTTLLTEMKKDLDYIFKRIRIVKNKLSQQYPQAFNGKYIDCFKNIMFRRWFIYTRNFDVIEAVRSSLAEEVIVEDVDCPVKPLEPEIVPLPSTPQNITDRDPDSDGNQTCTTSNRIAAQ